MATLVGACQTTPGPATSQEAANPLIKPRAASGSPLTAVRATSELAVGRNRFAIGLLDSKNQPVTQGGVLVQFFTAGKNNSTVQRGKASAHFRAVGAPNKGIWVAAATFEDAGAWSAQITLSPDDDAEPVSTRMNFEVMDKFSTPGYGEPATRSVTATAQDVGGDVSRICSNSPPCAMHTLSVGHAIGDHSRPAVITFATPALCTSALCGPQLQAVDQLRMRYAEQANFVHVDIYEYPFDGTRPNPAVSEWHLPSDPWTFVVDKDGMVQGRFEGPAPSDELEESLQALLA